MPVFFEDRKIEKLLDELGDLITDKFWKVVVNYARFKADELIDKLGLDTVCSDIDNAIQYAEQNTSMLSLAADNLTLYDYDSTLLYAFPPRGTEEPDMRKAAEKVVESMDWHNPLAAGLDAYAEELWINEIKKEMRRILEERCTVFQKYRV